MAGISKYVPTELHEAKADPHPQYAKKGDLSLFALKTDLKGLARGTSGTGADGTDGAIGPIGPAGPMGPPGESVGLIDGGQANSTYGPGGLIDGGGA